ncbi:GLPGLI family protein [Pedobacter sp. SL55]|uniref:GLPGLI family protein n=1 Tax=Pedobacter sp. SL55 TaxID=2995161 RepID=UPI00227204D8|nr:GLPGLI family protein [Pedobacter sp. SL55]WAC40528.1 GLPGLI family protein [Pedobacter sp. SL55]
MKILTTTLIAATISTFAFAQKADKALARVRYTFSHMRDTTQRDNFYTENMLLVTGNNASVYTSYDKINRDLEIKKSIEDQIKSQGGTLTSLNINRTSTKPVSPVDYFYFANENKFYTKERVISNYLVEETAPKINWKINKDTASFSGIKCQKATAYFKGRNWIAWFAPELPFQSGPWKLNGLPGLIIEAHDEKNEVKFQFAGIDKVIEEEKPKEAEQTIAMPNGGTGTFKFSGMDSGTYLGSEIKLPTDAVKTTQKEIDKLKEARDKDPQGFINAQMAGRNMGANIKTSTSFVAAPGGAKKMVMNNPIELPEKK